MVETDLSVMNTEATVQLQVAIKVKVLLKKAISNCKVSNEITLELALITLHSFSFLSRFKKAT
jgi:hypothetical protein